MQMLPVQALQHLQLLVANADRQAGMNGHGIL
jgi:hypothetical protein